MNRRTRRLVNAAAALLLLGLAACGVSGRGSQASGGLPSAEGTAVATRTAVAKLPSPATSPAETPTAMGTGIVRGAVTVTLDKPSYGRTDAITVYANNGLPASIFVADHQSGCTIVTLEQLIGGAWRPVGPCRLMTPTRLVEIPAYTTATAQFGRSPAQLANSPWPAGTYRVALSSTGGTPGASSPVYSRVFEIR